jgi:DNA-binding NarL/FixJ family response regulator
LVAASTFRHRISGTTKGSSRVEVVASADRSKSASILVIEDDPLVASYIESVLEESGFRVAGIAASADEALSLVSEMPPSLALVDIRLTGPIDGIELACLLREKHEVRSVFLTGFDDFETMERARAAKPLGFLAKPVRPSQIFRALETALGQLGD